MSNKVMAAVGFIKSIATPTLTPHPLKKCFSDWKKKFQSHNNILSSDKKWLAYQQNNKLLLI